MTELSVLFVNYNSWRLLAEALESLQAHPPQSLGRPVPFEVVVVDNASPRADPAHEARVRARVTELSGTVILHPENSGYSKGMNLAFARSTGRYVLVSNPDVLFLPECLTRLLAYAEAHPEVGAVVPEGLWDPHGECKLPVNILPTLADLFRLTCAYLSPRQVQRYTERRVRDALRVWTAAADVELEMLSGCCFLMQRDLYRQLGGFDEQFPLYFEDTDLSRRLGRLGRATVQVHGAAIVHLYGQSAESDKAQAMARYEISRRRYFRKWYGPLGTLALAAQRWLLDTRWARRRRALPPQPDLQRLPASVDKPRLRLPRACARFLVELTLDPGFFLAAGIFGSGQEWTPSDALFARFPPTTFYLRVSELQGGRVLPLGVWSYTRLPAEVPAHA